MSEAPRPMNVRFRKRELWLLTLALCSAVIVLLYVLLPKFYTCKYNFVTKRYFVKAISDYRQCLLDELQLHPDAFDRLPTVLGHCLDVRMWASFDAKDFHNGDESKLVIVPTSEQSCVGVTLGVGSNIKAERLLKSNTPHCQLFGADPILASGEIFREVGKYFEIAVGANSGVQKQSVLLADGQYQDKRVNTMDFVEFLTQHVGTRFVDIMLMDNEGAEYGLLPKYLIDNPPVRVCQLNMEMHGPLEKYGMNSTAFNKMILAVLARSPFLPFHVTTGYTHLQVFFLNVNDTECVDKYIFS